MITVTGIDLLYADYLAMESPELLLIPLTTNAFSGVYEFGKIGHKKYQKIRQKLIDSCEQQEVSDDELANYGEMVGDENE